ncbi:hypothetical protein Tco_0573835 [Tanacetum coccineum]
MELVQGATPICEGSCRLTSLERQEVWNDCRSYNVRVGSNGNLLWEVSVLHGGVEKSEIENSREKDVREVFLNKCGSGSKRKLSRCRRNQMGNEPILALPEGADDFVVYYDARSKDLEACLEKGEGEVLMKDCMANVIQHEAKMMDGCYLVSLISRPSHLGKANVDVVPWSWRRMSEARMKFEMMFMAI